MCLCLAATLYHTLFVAFAVNPPLLDMAINIAIAIAIVYQMPILVYAARVSPKDVEGSIYAFLTMVSIYDTPTVC